MELNEKGDRETSTYFGVVFKDGKLADKAILKAYVSPPDFQDALLTMVHGAFRTMHLRRFPLEIMDLGREVSFL